MLITNSLLVPLTATGDHSELTNYDKTRCEINNHFKNCPNLFEDKITQLTAEFFKQKNSVANELCNR